MDLSFLKWPIILGVIALIAWLGSSGGVNYMYKKFTTDPPGVDAKKDEINEAGLSRLGGYCLRLTKYQKATAIFEEASNRFPTGKNFWYNRYRMVRCAEKMKDFKRAVELMHEIIDADASTIDDRVANNDNLRLRSEKLIEMYELEKR